MKTALRTIKTLMVTMTAHRTTRMRLDIKRSRVRVNEVLLQTAARIENVPVKLPMKPRLKTKSAHGRPSKAAASTWTWKQDAQRERGRRDRSGSMSPQDSRASVIVIYIHGTRVDQWNLAEGLQA